MTNNTAYIIETERGWVIYPPNYPRGLSACPTYADAVRRCRRNGWDVNGEPRHHPSEPEQGIWVGALVLVSGVITGIVIGLLIFI